MTRIDHQKIHGCMSYTIKELADLLDIDEKTCLRWIEIGLKIVPESKRPILILGNDAKEFIRKKNSKKQNQTQTV